MLHCLMLWLIICEVSDGKKKPGSFYTSGERRKAMEVEVNADSRLSECLLYVTERTAYQTVTDSI